MIELMSDLPDNVIGLKASGKVTAEDYENVLIPAVEKHLESHDKIRIVYDLSEDLDGYSAAAMWDDTKVGFKHFRAWERIAIVSDQDWVENTIKVFGFLVPGDVKVFDDDDIDAAKAWASADDD